MKKIMMSLLIASAFAFGLTACRTTDTSVKNPADEQNEVVQKELTDPRGKTLEDTSTGETNPQIIETTYETKDVVIADIVPTEVGYALDPTGETDSTAGLQKALYDCYDAGGGTVYLPAGNYAISDTVYIPPYVTLRGDWQDPDEGTEYGTIISVWMESEDTEGAGAFKLGACGGAVGLTVYYPLQSLDCIMPYPYTFFVDGSGPNRRVSTVSNVTIINGYRGIGTPAATSHESLQIDNVKGTYLYCGLYAANSSEVGTVRDFYVSNKYWKEASADCMNAISASAIDDYTKKYTTGMLLGDLEWTVFNNIYIDGCSIGLHLVPGERIEFAGTFYDMSITNCKQGVVVDGLDSRWGGEIARSYIEGGLIHNAEGKLKLCDVEIVGEIKEKTEGNIVIDDETDLSTDPMDYDRTYTKPTSNLVIADIPNGLYTDAGPDLQAAIDKVATQGGGVVYVPGGTYRFKTPVTVPAGVELRGTSSVMTRDLNSLSNGTIFLCLYGDDATSKPEDQAFITLDGKNAGINGIRIVYAENSPKNDDLNTTYAIRGKATGVYAVNCMIIASAYGIDFSNCDNHYIDGIVSCCYYNTFRVGGNNGVITRGLHNPAILVRTSTMGLVDWLLERDMATELTNPILRSECEHIIVEDATNELIWSTFAYAVKTAVVNLNSENTYINNIGNDNIGTSTPQIYVDGGSLRGTNIQRYNGFSYELVSGKIELFNRIAINEVGEKTLIKEK